MHNVLYVYTGTPDIYPLLARHNVAARSARSARAMGL